MNDYELIYLIRERSEEAQDLIYQKYAEIIDIILKKKKNYLDWLDIDYDDIFNRCMMALCRAIKAFDENNGATFKTFAGKVIEIEIRNYIYVQIKKMELNGELNNILKENYDWNVENDPSELLIKKEELKEKRTEELAKLSFFEQQVYYLILNEVSYKQISNILNKSEKQIYNAIKRIKDKLKLVGNA